jgi:hypothetical protein
MKKQPSQIMERAVARIRKRQEEIDAMPIPTHYQIDTPLDERTPDICRSDYGRIVTEIVVPHNTGDPKNPCRCRQMSVSKLVYRTI